MDCVFHKTLEINSLSNRDLKVLQNGGRRSKLSRKSTVMKTRQVDLLTCLPSYLPTDRVQCNVTSIEYPRMGSSKCLFARSNVWLRSFEVFPFYSLKYMRRLPMEPSTIIFAIYLLGKTNTLFSTVFVRVPGDPFHTVAVYFQQWVFEKEV